VLDGKEWNRLRDVIPTDTVRDLRDRALIATLTYSFARIGVALKMKVPCHHALAEALRAYIDAAHIAEDKKGWLFRTSPRHSATALTERPMQQDDAWRMVRRRAATAGNSGTDRQSHVSGNRHHSVSREWRRARACPVHGRA
jgi:hypothetical protein